MPGRRARIALLAAVAAVAAGCGGEGSEQAYTAADVKAAYFKPADAPPVPPRKGLFVDQDFHSHQNFVPLNGLETCPLAQRANVPNTSGPNMIQPNAAQPVQQYYVGPEAEDDLRTPRMTQGALVFGTSTIAAAGMKAVGAAMSKCPASYDVRGGPSPILGTYNVSARPLKLAGWEGVAQQIAHTYPPGQDNVYYEDLTHLVVHRGNVILYLDVTHRKIIGERSDSARTAEAALKTVLTRLG